MELMPRNTRRKKGIESKQKPKQNHRRRKRCPSGVKA
jgi:hypothetical protein